MRVVVLFERSGVVRRAFAARGHSVVSVDLAAAEDGSPDHVRMDVREFFERNDPALFDLMIAFPDCTFLAGSGLHWNGRRPGRLEKTEEALAMIRWLMLLPIRRKAIENPRGAIGSRIRRAFQVIQPYCFGHDASKETHLWLDGLMPLPEDPRLYVEPRLVGGRPRWGNQTDSGQNRLSPSPTRAMEWVRTYEGVAQAMARWWGGASLVVHSTQELTREVLSDGRQGFPVMDPPVPA